MSKRIITLDDELNIIQYYQTHTDANTRWQFHIGRSTLDKILNKHNCNKHTPEENKKLRVDLYVQNCINKYGVTNPSKRPEVKSKIKQTCIDKYGVSCVFAYEQTKDKIKQTCLERYGVEYASQGQLFQQHVKNTCIEKYGSSCVFGSEEIKNKIKETCLERYGAENVSQTQYFRDKIKETSLEKYGVEYYTQSPLYKGRKKFKIFCDNDIYFDSFPELCFYLYNKSIGNDIIRNPIRLQYEFNSTVCYTFIDFSVNNKLYEIKGDHLYAKMLIENTHDNAKLKCLLDNDVTILTYNDYKKYEEWFFKNGYIKESFKC